MPNLQFSIFNFQFAIVMSVGMLLAPYALAEAPLAVPSSGEPFHAELAAVDADWQVTFIAGQKRRTMAAADLVCWGQCVEQGRAGGLVLADGGLLVANVTAADAEKLSADSDLFGTLKLPLESLSGIIFHPPSAQADRDKLLDRIAQRFSPLPTNLRSVPGEGQQSISPLPLGEGQGVRAVGVTAVNQSDRLLLDNGDEAEGLLTGIAKDVVKLDRAVGPIEVSTDRITAIIFNPALKRKSAAKPNALQAWIGLSDGSRLLVPQLLLESRSLTIMLAGQSLTALPTALVFVQPLGGRAVYLSDLKPAEYRQTPYLDLPWPYQTDRNVTGGLLRCGGRLYFKGLGVHSAARLEYALEGPEGNLVSPLPTNLRSVPGEGQGVRAKRFEADLGIDDSTAGQGSVRFRVLVDGQEKFASPIIRGGGKPLPVSVDVSKGKKIELIVDYADRADVLDHADWLNARLTK